MRGILNSLGWILFLALAAFALVFYNFAYLPQDGRISRLKQEIGMWTRQVQTLSDSLRLATVGPDTVLNISIPFDILFVGTDSFRVCQQGQAKLREHIVKLRETSGSIQVIGHTDDSPLPERLRQRFSGNWDFAAAKAAAVASELINWGIPARQVQVASAGSARPLTDNATAVGRATNRRVQLLALAR
jgi:flagellar motor protein MotB